MLLTWQTVVKEILLPEILNSKDSAISKREFEKKMLDRFFQNGYVDLLFTNAQKYAIKYIFSIPEHVTLPYDLPNQHLQSYDEDNLMKQIELLNAEIIEVPEPETVASHMYRMAVLSMALGELDGVDISKCIKMCLIHDIGEAIVGDITPKCGYSDESKFKLEEDSYVPESIGNEWLELWYQYENPESIEAKIVKQLDKLDMIAQAYSYELKYGIDLSEFFDSTVNLFKMQPFIDWDLDIRQKRIDRKYRS